MNQKQAEKKALSEFLIVAAAAFIAEDDGRRPATLTVSPVTRRRWAAILRALKPKVVASP